MVPAGKHAIDIKVYNEKNVPTIFVKGKTIASDISWLVTFEDKVWINESGKASDASSINWNNAGCWNFNSPDQLPSAFALPVTKMLAATIAKENKSILADFGKETFGFLKLHGVKGAGRVNVYYGESK